MGTAFLARAYHFAKGLLSRDRAEPRPGFIAAVICFVVIFTLGVSMAHVTRGFVLGLYSGWAADFLFFLGFALLIVGCGKQFSRYYLDKVSLICIIVFRGFLGPLPARGPAWVVLLWIVPDAILGLWLYRRLRAVGGFRGGKLTDLPCYFLGGVAVAALLVLVASRFNYPYGLLVSTLLHAKPLYVIDAFATNMSIAAATQEPIYRGFLLGYLIRDRGWKPSAALLVQSAAFMLPHLHYINEPFTFWIVLPIIAIVLGLVTVRTGNIATAMFAHAIYDTVANIVTAARG